MRLGATQTRIRLVFTNFSYNNDNGAGFANEWPDAGDSGKRADEYPSLSIAPESASAEELKLVQRLFFLSGIASPRVVVFCGVEPRDGSASVCVRTGELLAALVKQPVCLIDANLLSPSLHLRYGIDNVFGLADARPEHGKEKVRLIRGRNLWVLPAGIPNGKRPILSPNYVQDCITRLREQFGYVLISAPSLGSYSDAVLLGQMTDGLVLVLKAHSTRRTMTLKARQSLENYNVRLLGAVLNNCKSPS